MKVKELIDLLKTFDSEMLIVHGMYSEYLLLDGRNISMQMLCEPRNDGWVADARPDKPLIPYVVFPGN